MYFITVILINIYAKRVNKYVKVTSHMSHLATFLSFSFETILFCCLLLFLV